MSEAKLILVIVSASLLGAVNWGNKICLFFFRHLSALFFRIRDVLDKALRLHFAVFKREIRRRQARQRQAKPAPSAKTAKSSPIGNIVGSTKTVFITELPDPDELQPTGTIELPLSEPEKPEELPFPENDEPEQENDSITAEDLRETQEAMYGDESDRELPEEYSSGMSVEDMTDAYNALHNEGPAGEIEEETVAKVLDSLKGTDMFGLLINSDQSERKAKEIMDRHFEKYHRPRSQEKKSRI